MEAARKTHESGSDQRRTQGAPANQPGKTKRTLTIGASFTTLGNVLASGPVLIAALFRPKTSAALSEKVFLGVTSVNDCRYCSWGHSHWARAHGVSLEEVNQILSQQIESLQARNPAEAAAILFAQHYAEHLERFDPEAIGNLRQYYDDGQVRDRRSRVVGSALPGLPAAAAQPGARLERLDANLRSRSGRPAGHAGAWRSRGTRACRRGSGPGSPGQA